MFELAFQWLVVGVDVVVKSVLLAAIAAIALQWPRLRDSNLRHRVWTGVLIGMLILPALSQTVPHLQLPVTISGDWRFVEWDNVPVPDPEAAATFPSPMDEKSGESLSSTSRNSPFAESHFRSPGWNDAEPFPATEFVFDSEAAVSPPLESSNAALPAEGELGREPLEAASTTPPTAAAGAWPPRWPIVLFGFWLAGVCLMTLRLLIGLVYSFRLAQSSTVIGTDDLSELGVDPLILSQGARQTSVWECPLIRVPLALGIFRPRILIPSDWPAWSAEKLHAVIAHERTHIERADGAVIFLAEVNRCLYWFHPLAWWLRHHLGRLAETACDDAAIDCTGDRATYARHLLEVAAAVSSQRTRLITAGISMARPSHVETRINTILDLTRPLTQRLTWRATLLLLATLIPLITVTAAVQPAKSLQQKPSTNGTDTTVAVSTDEPAQQLAGPSEAEGQSRLALRGDELESQKAVIDPEPETTTPTHSDSAADVAGQDSAGRNTRILQQETAIASRHPSAGTRREAGSAAPSYSGRVETSEGEPIAGARIWLTVTSFVTDVPAILLHPVGVADDEGRFRFVIDGATAEAIGKIGPFGRRRLVAKTAGRGLDWLPLEVFEDDPAPSDKRDMLQARIDAALGEGRFASRTLKLRPETRPVRGRLVDLEGRPLPNVKVLVESLRQPDIPLLLKAFKETSTIGVYDAWNATGAVSPLSRDELQKLIPPVTTDGNGHFELRGIGDDQLASLSFAGEGVQAQVVYVLGRTMETVRLPHSPFAPQGAKDVFAGRDFNYAVGPSITLEGIVKDYDTGEPVAGAFVYVERLFGGKRGTDEGRTRFDTRHMRAMTDENGRFRISGLPPGTGHVLEAIPSKSEPYLMASQNVSLDPENGNVQKVEIQVKKGIWIEGTVTDKRTGRPLSATVDYLALQKNPHTIDKLGLKQAWRMHRFHTDSEGRYRTLGLPGPGVLLTRAEGGYPLMVGAETVDGYRANQAGGYIPTTPLGLPLSNWNLIKQIDPPPDAESFVCDLVLDAGLSIAGRVVGPDGKPVPNLSVLGEIAKAPFWKPRAGSEFRIEGYDGKGPRQLFFKNQEETLIGQYRLEGAPPEEIVVKLQRAVRVTGRLIENETEFPAARYGLFCEECTLGNFRIDSTRTDDEGRFEIKGLLAGLVYEMNAFNEQRFSNNRNRFKIDLTTAKPGDVIELGDITDPNGDRTEK